MDRRLSRLVVLVILTLAARALPGCVSAGPSHDGSAAAEAEAGAGHGAGCVSDGQTHGDGESWVTALGCYYCTCSNGVSDCQAYASSSNIECWGDLFPSDAAPPDTVPPVVCNAADIAVSPNPAPVLQDDRLFVFRSATDAQGFAYVTGSPSAAIDLANGDHLDAKNVYLLRLDPDGQIVWGRQFKSAVDFYYPTALALAANGDALIAGYRPYLGSDSPEREWIRRYDSAGNALTVDEVPATAGFGEFATNLVETPTGDLELWGEFGPSWTLGSTTIETGMYPQGFRLRFSPTGNVAALYRIGLLESEDVQDVVMDGAGTSYVAIEAQHIVDNEVDPPHGLLAAFDSQMNVLWQRDLGEWIIARRLAVIDGALEVVGAAQATPPEDTTKDYLFVGQFQLSSGQSLSWKSQPIANRAWFPAGAITSLAVLPSSDIVIGGELVSDATIGDFTLRSASYPAPFLARLTSAGDPVWATVYCSTTRAQIEALDFGGGSLKAVISFQGDVELGSFQLHAAPFSGSTALIQLPAETTQ